MLKNALNWLDHESSSMGIWSLDSLNVLRLSMTWMRGAAGAAATAPALLPKAAGVMLIHGEVVHSLMVVV